MDDLFSENKLQAGLMISECRDKKLKATHSWSSNLLLKVYFILKKKENEAAKKSPKEFVESVQEEMKANFQNI